MPRYLVAASYTADGVKGLLKDKASGRKASVTRAVEALGGKLECFYFAFGADDAVIIAELPDNVTAAALALSVAASGLVNARTTALLTVEEVDRAIGKSVDYRPPGAAKRK
jgi:uncharacterized protein with GYD domain